MELQGMIVCRIEASGGDASKTYSVVDFDDREEAVYGIVNSLFRGDALIVKSLDYSHPSNAKYKTEGCPQPEVQLFTQEEEILGILRQYVEFS